MAPPFFGSVRLWWSSMGEGVVDFEGQFFIQRFLLFLTIAGGFVGFAIGLATHSFCNSVVCAVTTCAAAAFICVPSWPAYSCNRISWTPHDPQHLHKLQSGQEQAQRGGGDSSAVSKGSSSSKSGGTHKAKAPLSSPSFSPKGSKQKKASFELKRRK